MRIGLFAFYRMQSACAIESIKDGVMCQSSSSRTVYMFYGERGTHCVDKNVDCYVSSRLAYEDAYEVNSSSVDQQQ